MKKYLLTAVVNGHELPSRKFRTMQKATIYRDRLIDQYGLQIADEGENGNGTLYRCEQYRTWFLISTVA